MSKRLTIDMFIKKANIVHNYYYLYDLVDFILTHDNIVITCPKHGEFQQTPDAHLQGRGCPNCNSSKAERKIQAWLETNHISFVSQKTFPDCKNPITNYSLRFDFYVPSKNLLIDKELIDLL